MNRIITISREFGSGGREIGKRMAEKLGFAYYDREIIKAVAEHSGVAEEYVNSIVEKKDVSFFPITYAHSFSTFNPLIELKSKIFFSQQQIIKEMADKSDCVIVGRCADSILKNYAPLKLFVYADMPSKIARCRTKVPEEADFSDDDFRKKILKIDKHRAGYCAAYSDVKWGAKENYHLCINTSDISIPDAVPSLCQYALTWFEQRK